MKEASEHDKVITVWRLNKTEGVGKTRDAPLTGIVFVDGCKRCKSCGFVLDD